jgi:ubiquitin carboxyl-terminal hydrolase 36/42
VHLKRFSPLGRKIGHHVQYEENLLMQPYMSEGQFGPAYSLYGVICHAGGGPNSGHYYAFVKSKAGQWWEMNDESVTTLNGGPPVNKRTAYMLFYIRKKGQELEAAMGPRAQSTPHLKPNLVSGMKKRKEREGEQAGDVEDKGVQVSKPFIGPLLPSTSTNTEVSDAKRQKTSVKDPQAALVKTKIEAAAAAQARVALTSLGAYASEGEDEGEKVDDETKETATPVEAPPAPSSPPPLPPSSSPPVAPSNFYGESNPKKRKAFDAESDEARKADARKRIPVESRSEGYSRGYSGRHDGGSMNPYTSLRGKGKHRSRPRGF